ncbi:MAG: ketopantoate reductase family protein [Alistipes onderdonkii]
MKTKIAIVGTGGVGGFLGGLLARHYEGSSEVEIHFISRGEALANIRRDGLRVDAQQGAFTARPTTATDSAAEIGTMDYVLYCTKAYDVEGGIAGIRPCIGPRTVILPFLNGVDSAEKIKRMLPDNEVWDGCVYVVAYIVEPGHIVERTNGYRYLFGSPPFARPAEELHASSPKPTSAPGSKRSSCGGWDKFAFISTVATPRPTPTRPRRRIERCTKPTDFMALLDEFQAVAQDAESRLGRHRLARRRTDGTHSRRHDDFHATGFPGGRSTEVESLTGYVVREGRRPGVPTPVYDLMYRGCSKEGK